MHMATKILTQVHQFQNGFFKDNRKTECKLLKSLSLRLQCLAMGQFSSSSTLTCPYRFSVQ